MKRAYESPVAEKVQFRYAEQVTASADPADPTNPNDPIRDYLMAAILGDCSSYSCTSLMSIFG
ncbi:MAG: hypothetical protein ACI3XR_09370 [Eubacteriales bacterium]